MTFILSSSILEAVKAGVAMDAAKIAKAILQERYVKELIWSKDGCPEFAEKGKNLTPFMSSKLRSGLNDVCQALRHPKRLGRLRRKFWKIADAL